GVFVGVAVGSGVFVGNGVSVANIPDTTPQPELIMAMLHNDKIINDLDILICNPPQTCSNDY
ncbi:MAG: hypothetical protein N2C13_00415, partial [Chloroflexota bacterium]